MGLKIAVAGKGGAGKTTVCAMLAGVLARAGRKVLLVDLDSNPSLASAVGVPADRARPLVHRADLVAERTAGAGSPGGYFVLNPVVSDIAEKHAIPCGPNLFLLPVGTIESAGEGCFCPQAALVRALISRLVLAEAESVVLDLEAGLEPFGRSVAEGLDLLLVVVEPGMRAVETAARIAGLARATDIRRLGFVANKVRPENASVLAGKMAAAGLPVDVRLEYNPALASLDLEGRSIIDCTDDDFERQALGLLRRCDAER